MRTQLLAETRDCRKRFEINTTPDDINSLKIIFTDVLPIIGHARDP